MTTSSRRPLFSVVIPTLNRRDKLVHAIQSVIDQTLNDFEILVVDDGSDGTEAMLEEQFRGRVRYMRGPGSGVSAARNFAIERSTGEWIAFLDSDDWWYPTKLERYASAARTYPETGLFYSKMDLVDAEGRYILTSVIRRHKNAYPAVLQGNFMFISTVAVKRECLERTGLFDPTLVGCEDWDLFTRVSRHFPARLIDASLTAYEPMSAGSGTRVFERWAAGHDQVIAKALAADPELSPRVVARIHAALDYAKAMIYVAVGEDRRALLHFKAAFRGNRRLWRAPVYIAVLSWKSLRRFVPRRFKVLMRLPEALQ